MLPGDAQRGNPGSSSTPARPKALAQATSSLKSTPNSRGAATISENIDLVGVQVGDLWPWIKRDIEQAKTCEADTMLQVFLQRASLDPETEQPALLPRCLEAVLHVCNGTAPPKIPDDKLLSSCVKKALETYASSEGEKDYYDPFIRATNIALACLDIIKVDGMPVASGLDIICQQHADKGVKQGNQKQEPKRKPDVVIVPLQTSRDAFPGWNMGEPELMTKFATMMPENNISWKDVLASIEFKRKAKTGKELDPPPGSYAVTNYVAPKPEHLEAHRRPNQKDLCPTVQPSAVRPVSLPSNSSSKRKAEEPLQSSSKRVKVKGTDTDKDSKLPVTVQTGLYAAEMFAANVGVKHVLNLIVIDNIVWVWYYDRQGTIQCSGIDFIADLPRFMVLLRIGVETSTSKNAQKEGYLKLDIDGVDLELHTSSEERVTHYGLKGRATNVFPVTSEFLAKKYANDAGVKKDGMVAKIFWAEEQRDSEPEILKKVAEIAEKEEAVKGHVPQLLWSHKFENPTSAVRKALGVPEAEKGSRVLYILVFRKLLPITALEGEELFNVWRQCILCHVALWKGGVHHRDVSPPNMMFYKTDKGVLIGVLNDFDLSSLATRQGPQGNERTGTVPFMALDLLTPEGQRGEVEHLYRHDLESFVWVLVWVCLRYRQGVLLPPQTRPFDAWATAGPAACGEKKLWFQNHFLRYRPSDIEPRMWGLVSDCLVVLKKDAERRFDLIVERESMARAREETDAEESASDIDDEQPHAEEPELAIDDFLRKFTSTKGWIRLSKRLP
ncbi:uncharacterized protein EDB91DRAFT_1080942 [Suillus paluster]|uniref:uncharacterized protein n=1 Tax=Suillus paluster TaxID=48578 RepID=UPI001B8687A7|nr:uncharacterized protein EDB91DRAFT_1080942 [Suillus paluster]KAG1744150.1 hypothetical protein EDB91DRAFT_1080942 [Suillus paluster]